jgi:hypothetical protein
VIYTEYDKRRRIDTASPPSVDAVEQRQRVATARDREGDLGRPGNRREQRR